MRVLGTDPESPFLRIMHPICLVMGDDGPIHIMVVSMRKVHFVQSCGNGKFEDGSGSDSLSDYGSG
jgi:hypothetical protein